MLIFNVYPGIGDISWIYSKVLDLAKDRDVAFRVLDCEPRRSKPFIDLLPYIHNLGYGPGFPDFSSPQTNGVPQPLPASLDLMTLPHRGTFTLGFNSALENGTRIEHIHPQQTTHYHYELNIPRQFHLYAETARRFWDSRPVIGYYASSYQHRPRMTFWSPQEWMKFLGGVRDEHPDALFIALGAKWDDRSVDLHNLMVKNGFKSQSLIGQMHIGATLAVMQYLDYFFAFPSGLGIMADVLDVPCTMWYWRDPVTAFINSYADPTNIDSCRHVNRLYESVDEALEGFYAGGARWLSR